MAMSVTTQATRVHTTREVVAHFQSYQVAPEAHSARIVAKTTLYLLDSPLAMSAFASPTAPFPKRRRLLLEPDVLVVVGDGEDRREFPCYKAILCLASEVFDVMLFHEMKEQRESVIKLRDKDPPEWELFYAFIDPETARFQELNKENVMILLPWFHEYRMMSLVEQCDEIIEHMASKFIRNDRLVRFLEAACRYDLNRTKANVVLIIRRRFEDHSIALEKDLLTAMEPLLLRDEFEESLWHPIRDLLPENLRITEPRQLFRRDELVLLVMKEYKLRVMKKFTNSNRVPPHLRDYVLK